MCRVARVEDVDAIYRLGLEIHGESRFKVMNVDETKAKHFFRMCVEQDCYLALVVEVEGEIVGVFIGMVMEHFFSYDKQSSDLLLFVTKSMRSRGLAKVFIEHYIEWAESNGAKLIQAGVSTGIATDDSTEMYKKLGFSVFGSLFERVK